MLLAFLASVAAGVLGSILGLGGGIIVVPALTLLLGVDIRYAIGASIVSVIATSSGAGAAYVRKHLANVRLSMFLEVGTTVGALGGAFLAGVVPERWLLIVFSGALLYAAWAMWRHREKPFPEPGPPDVIADRLALHSSYHDEIGKRDLSYQVCHTRLGFVLSILAGVLSGLLGIGGGVIKVPLMALAMRVPIKVASATSNFMIGVTAAASAGVYFARGDVDPFIAGPTAAGVVIGSVFGAKVMGRIHSSVLRTAFTIILLIVAWEMLHKGITLQ